VPIHKIRGSIFSLKGEEITADFPARASPATQTNRKGRKVRKEENPRSN
jgi:hypothetical protein